MKRIVSCFLVLVLALTAGLVSASAEEGKKVVSIGLQMNANVEDYDTNVYTKYLEDKLNIEIEFMLMEELDKKLPVLIASNSELPDIILGNIDTTTLWNYVQQGAFVPLTKYWKDESKLTNFKQGLIDQRASEGTSEYMITAITMLDGEIYALPQYDENLWNLAPYRAWINQEWLTKLNLKVPTTTAELVDVLTHFVKDDPNGNGIADEVGIVSMANGWGSHPLYYLMNAFIHANPGSNFFNVENGVITPSFTKDAFKKALEFCNELYDAGLIAPESFTQDQTQMRAMVNGEVPLCGIVMGGSASNFQSEYAKENYVVINPLIGPDGVCLTPTSPASVTNMAYVTRDAEDVDLCWELLEMQYDFTVRHNFRVGREGVEWSTDPEICKLYKGNFEVLSGLLPTCVLIDNIFGKPNNVIWGSESMPFISTQDYVMHYAYNLKNEENEGKIAPEELHYIGYAPCQPEELLGNLIYTQEELDVLTMVQNTVQDYVKESMVAFATGNREFSDWDNYLKELKAMGLDDYIAVLQSAYDRLNAK